MVSVEAICILSHSISAVIYFSDTVRRTAAVTAEERSSLLSIHSYALRFEVLFQTQCTLIKANIGRKDKTLWGGN